LSKSTESISKDKYYFKRKPDLLLKYISEKFSYNYVNVEELFTGYSYAYPRESLTEVNYKNDCSSFEEFKEKYIEYFV